jgi:DNA-binding response OmpR family regulator
MLAGALMADSGDSHNIDIGAVTQRVLALAKDTRPRILVVDDDEIALELICDRLKGCGFDAWRAIGGVEALQLLEREWFPVIVTDWQMPVLSGIEMVEQLRARGVTDTYVLMLTVLDSSFDYERAYSAGVDDYLTKKAPDVELLARIHAAFSTVNLRRSLREAREALAQR